MEPRCAALRPVYDLFARCIGALPLTPPGQAIQLAFAAGICILNDETRGHAIFALRGQDQCLPARKSFPDGRAV